MLRRTFLAQALLALRQDRLDEAEKILSKATSSKEVTVASLAVRNRTRTVLSTVGDFKGESELPFLIASITKPMTVTAVMVLAGKGEVKLEDRVGKFIPEFTGGDRSLVTVKHLLTHTSGLPDMLPDNERLRARQAPLKEFVALTCQTPLLFKPGTKCQYQSMGILLAAEIAERVTTLPFREFLKRSVFDPLGMTDTSLGLGGRRIGETAPCQVTGNLDWNWNSPYWRNLGAPWGGAHSTSRDILKFLDYFLKPDSRVLKPEAAETMIVNQNAGLNEPWGLGWAVKKSRMGRACSSRAFGHSGSTGTVCWADPATDTSFALLTTKPAAESRDTILTPVSDLISEAVA